MKNTYIKKTLKDKKVILAIILVVVFCVLGLLGYYKLENKTLKFISLAAGSILMFLQFPTISTKAMEYAKIEEDEEKQAKKAQLHKTKKK